MLRASKHTQKASKSKCSREQCQYLRGKCHLIALAKHSDIVFHMVLLLADRHDGADAE